MREKDFQNNFGKWLKVNWKETSTFELKICKTNALSFDAVKPHQENALYVAKHGCLYYKIPDLGQQNPFDCLNLVNVSAFIVIMYYKPRKQEFIIIDIDDWLEEKKTSKRKSLTVDRAMEIGCLKVL